MHKKRRLKIVYPHLLREFVGRLQSGEVHGFEYILVQLHRLRAFEGQPHLCKGVSQPLHSNSITRDNIHTHQITITKVSCSEISSSLPDGSVSEVGVLGLFHGVEVDVDDLVQVSCHHLRHLIAQQNK